MKISERVCEKGLQERERIKDGTDGKRANSKDPTMRNWLNAARSYMRPIEIGEPMRAAGIGRVVNSRSKNIAVGDLVCPFWERKRKILIGRYMELLIGRNIGLGEMIK